VSKSKMFNFCVEIYGARIHIFHCCEEEEVTLYLEKQFPGVTYERNNSMAAITFVCEHKNFGNEYCVDFITPLKTSSPGSHNTISHESLHIVCEISKDRGLKFDLDNLEPINYLLGHIVQKINEEVFKKNKDSVMKTDGEK